jgi:hypothetical protein
MRSSPDKLGPLRQNGDSLGESERSDRSTEQRSPTLPRLDQDPPCGRIRQGQRERRQTATTSEVHDQRIDVAWNVRKKAGGLDELIVQATGRNRADLLCVLQALLQELENVGVARAHAGTITTRRS